MRRLLIAGLLAVVVIACSAPDARPCFHPGANRRYGPHGRADFHSRPAWSARQHPHAGEAHRSPPPPSQRQPRTPMPTPALTPTQAPTLPAPTLPASTPLPAPYGSRAGDGSRRRTRKVGRDKHRRPQPTRIHSNLRRCERRAGVRAGCPRPRTFRPGAVKRELRVRPAALRVQDQFRHGGLGRRTPRRRY